MIRAKIINAMKTYPKFYQKVWTECANIPRGTTISYSELARRIGSPRAARAVGLALARNPFAPEIPCHRVIRADGKMGGYSGPCGVARKIELLKAEARRRKVAKGPR